MITSEQYEILCHTSRTGRYVADPNCNLIELRQDGLLLDHGAQRLADGMHYFTLTTKGREAIRQYRAANPAKQPKPPTRGHKRYLAFLRCTDATGCTFREFLTKPCFEEVRQAA